jgi:hypothetical protein
MVGDKEVLDSAIEKGRGSVLRWKGGGENIEWLGIKVRICFNCILFYCGGSFLFHRFIKLLGIRSGFYPWVSVGVR